MKENKEFVIKLELDEFEKVMLITSAARCGVTVEEYIRQALGF